MFEYLIDGETVTIPREQLEETLSKNPNAEFVKEIKAGKTTPSLEKMDAPVEDKDMASRLDVGSLEPQKNDSILYENYQKATDVTEEEIEKRFVDDYFELTKLDRKLIEEGVEGAPFGVKRKLTEKEKRNLIPLDRIEDYDKYIETGEINISELDRFETIKKIKEDKADDYYLNLSNEDRQRTSDLLTDKNLKIDNLKETLTTKSDQLDKIINQSNEELKPIETQMEEIGKKLERINDIYSGFVQPTDEKVSEFNNLKEQYENLFEQRKNIIDNYNIEFEGYNKFLKDYQIKAEDYAGNIAGIDSAKKNYNILSQFGQQLEKQVLGGASSIAGKFSSEIQKNSINYNEKLDEKIKKFPRRLKIEEVTDAKTFGRFAIETLTDQALSIGASLIPYAGKIFKGGKYIKQARGASMGLYGVSTFGNRAFEMEKRDLDIAERIKEINTFLDSDDISPQERTQLFLEKNELENIIPYNEAAKILVPALNAGLEIGSERLGSMRFVESLADMGKTLGRMNIRKALPAALAQIPKGAIIENAEELTNQLSVNLVDKLVLGENKSIFEGINKEFFTKTSITALAIGGPGNVNNIINVVRNEVLTQNERRKIRGKVDELITIGLEFENKNLSRKEFNNKRKEILKSINLDQMVSLNKLNNLSIDDIKELGLTNLSIENLLKNTAILTANSRTSKEYKENEFAKAKKEYQDLYQKREQLLGKNIDNEFSVEGSFISGIYQLNKNIAEALVPKNGKVITLNAESRKELIEKNEGLTQEQIDGINTSNAFNQGNNIFINEDLILSKIANAKSINDRELLFAAASPAHELFHIKIGSDKIIINNKLKGNLKYATKNLKSTLKEKFESGRIKNKEDYNAIIKRLDSYKGDVEEYFTTIFDAYNLGLITDSDVDLDYAMKTVVEKALSLIQPNSTTFGLINNSRDAFNYIKLFNNKIKTSLKPVLAQDEDEQELKFSKNILALYDQYGRDHVDMITNSLTTEDVTKSEFGQSIGGLIESITKRLFDGTLPDATKVIDENRFKAREMFKKEVTEDAAIMILNEYKAELGNIDKFVTSRLNLRANSKLKEMGVMPSVEKGGLGVGVEVTESVIKDADEQIQLPQEEIKTSKPFAEKLELDNDFKNKIVKAVENTFSTKLPSVTEKKFRIEFEKKNRAELTPILQKQLADKDDFKRFLIKNYETILGKLPQRVVNKKYKNFGAAITDETGKQIRAKTKVGEGQFKKVKPTKEEFVDYFTSGKLGSSTRSDRKQSLLRTIIDELSFDAALDAINNPDVIAKLELQGIEVNKLWAEELKKAIERDQLSIDDLQNKNKEANIKYSKFIEELNNQGLDSKYAYDFVELFQNDRGKAGDKNIELYQALLDDENIAIDWKAHETQVLNNLTAASSKIPALKIVSTKIAANDNKFIDMQLVANGNKIGIEVKLDHKARVGTAGRIYQDKNGNLVFKSPEGINLEGLLDSNNPQIIEFKKLFQEWLDVASKSEGKKIQMNAGKNGLTTDKLSPKTSAALKESGLQAKIGRTYIKIPIQTVLDYYINKDKDGYKGEYIMLNNKLYSLGNDPLNTNAPKLDSEATVNIRLRGDAIEADRYKPENEKIKSYRISAEVRLKDEKGRWNVNDSSIELNKPEDYVNTFSNIKYSKVLEDEMNSMIERKKGVDIEKTFSEPQARRLGQKAERIKLYVPYTAEDLLGLTYRFAGKGEQGNKDLKFFKENLFDPLTEANILFEATQQDSEKALDAAKKIIKNQKVDLTKEAIDGYTNDHVIRIFMWNRRGYKVPELSEKDQAKIVKYARQNFDIVTIADAIESAYPNFQYGQPDNTWVTGTITTDLLDFTSTITRDEIYQKFFDNAEAMFGKFNKGNGRLTGPIANKIRAAYGNTFIKALESSLYRIYTGRNRLYQLDKQGNIILDWMNNAIGNIMFINTRSALLQTISNFNFTNWTDNNPLKIAARWADIKQFRKDFVNIFNSDYLQSRRGGLKTDVQEQEIAEAAKNSKNKVRAMIAVILKKGFYPTQIADSFAIALGGASFYRNRANTYIKQGFEKAEAESKAFADMREISETTQQSGRPEKISMEQAGFGGRLILAFQNTPMQYNRIIKRAIQDLYNGRGVARENISKIITYGILQNALFYALQQALFTVIFDEPETTEEEKKEKKRYYSLINGMVDSILRGSGVFGALVSTGKNTILKVLEREGFDEKAIEEIANLSPPLGKKTRQLFDIRDKFQFKQNKQKIKELGLDTRNPAILAAADALSFGVNLPADRALRKINNLRTAMEKETEMWQRIALSLGWSEWELNIDRDKQTESKVKLKGLSKKRSSTKSRLKRKSLN